MRRITQETQVDDLIANPKSFGLPTYEEFRKNPKWALRPRADNAMETLERGPESIRGGLRKIIRQVHYVTIDNDTEFERILSDYGYTIADIDMTNPNPKIKMKMSFVDITPGTFDLVVNFLPEERHA